MQNYVDFFSTVKAICLLHLIFCVYSSNIRGVVSEKKNDNLLIVYP